MASLFDLQREELNAFFDEVGRYFVILILEFFLNLPLPACLPAWLQPSLKGEDVASTGRSGGRGAKQATERQLQHIRRILGPFILRRIKVGRSVSRWAGR
jgi:hypothetical protein